MCKIGLITYDYAHLKTEQVMNGLIRKNNLFEAIVYALPFIPRFKKAEPLLKHRPDQIKGISAASIAKAYDIPYNKCESDLDIDNGCDIYLVLGSGILSKECIDGKKIINCHPGIIPAARGLDSFKWSVLKMKPLGVTLHYIDESVDEGEIIAVIPTPVYQEDTIETFARRHYENEIGILVDYEFYLNNPNNSFASIQSDEPCMRMKRTDEVKMISVFEEYKQEYRVKNIYY